jgi:hypothetical protein
MEKAMNDQMRQRMSAKTPTLEQLRERENRLQELQIKKAEGIANAERDAPIRARFHDWLESAGFRRFNTPPLGASYPSSHVETLWEAYVDATLREREGQK